MFYVYVIQNIQNLKVYVGWSNNCKKRWGAEKNMAFNEKQPNYNSLLSRAFRKYAKNSKDVENFFTFQVIEEFENLEESKSAEMFWIEFLRSNIHQFSDKYGYNQTAGGDGTVGRVCSEETKIKIGAKNKGNTWTEERKKTHSERMSGENNSLFGIGHTEETKQIIREKALGRKHSDEARKKMSIARSGENHYFFGIPRTAEMKRKFKISMTGKLAGEKNPSAKLTLAQVIEIRKEYSIGNVTQIFLSKKYNVTPTTICSIVNNKIWKT